MSTTGYADQPVQQTATPTHTSPLQRLKWTFSDIRVMTWRNLLRYIRLPSLLAFSTIQPVMFLLLFSLVFGGAIATPGMGYIDYLMPGILIQTVLFGSIQTGVGLADDLSRGMIDRLRSLPIARSAVLMGRTLSDTIRNSFVVTLLVIVGYIIGLRFQTNLLMVIAALALVVFFGLAFSWIAATIGLFVGDAETTQVANQIWIFPLIFASSAFVPTDTMHPVLRTIALINPVTQTANAVRALTQGVGSVQPALFASLGWTIVLLLIFIPLAVYRYRHSV
jgi:ABC-2 type transport system permease protein/oleandomycin transport system permease protein